MGRRKLIQDDELLARVREIVVREGVNVSSREIAKEVGISSSVLFQRFGSKEDLLFAALTPPAPDISAIRRGARRDSGTQIARIILELLRYFRTLVPVLLPLATHPSFEYEEFKNRHPNAPLEKLTGELIAALNEERQEGTIECADVNHAALVLIAVAHSLAMFERIGAHHGEFSRASTAAVARVLWHGFAPTRQRRSRASRRGARAPS